jgi:hypothetical protein
VAQTGVDEDHKAKGLVGLLTFGPTRVIEMRASQRGASVICIVLAMMAASFSPAMAAPIDRTMTPNLTPTRLSGLYTFSGSLEYLRGQYMSFSGSLNFDSLGDISGEASSRRIGQHVRSTGSCHLLMEGTYKPTKDPFVMAGSIRFMPIYGDCNDELGRDRNWTISIMRGVKSGLLDLSHNSVSGRRFVGVATREAPRLS